MQILRKELEFRREKGETDIIIKSIKGWAPIMPFLSTISKQRGYSSTIVGLILTLIPLPALVAKPIVGALTDKYKCRKTALISIMVINMLFTCGLMFLPGMTVKTKIDDADVIKSPNFWLFFSTVTILNMGTMARYVLENTICISLLGENKYKYGEQRVWGAIGWGTTSFVSGVVIDWFSKGQDFKNYTPSIIVSLIAYFLNLIVVRKIEVVQNSESKNETSDVKKLFTKIRVQLFTFWVVAFGFLNGFVTFYFFWYLEDLSKIYHPETIPYIKTLEGFTITIQCLGGEIPFFFLSSYILKRVDTMKVFSLMFFAFAVRFFLYSIITNPVWVLPVELLNGLTYALAYSAMTTYVAELAPVGSEGTLQGIFDSSMGIGLSIGCFVGGLIIDRFGSITSFKLISGIALAMCITQFSTNWLMNRDSQDKDFKENASCTNDSTGGVVHDNL